MKYNNFRIRPITIREAGLILEVLKSFKIKIIYIGLNESYLESKMAINDFNYSKYAVIKENDTNIWIETRYYEIGCKATRYVCWLDDIKRPAISGLQAFNNFQRHCFKAICAEKYNCKLIDRYWDGELRKYVCSSSPLIGYNPKYEMQELHNVYEYDINSAYSSIMLGKIPDVNNPYFNCYIKKGQVGFLLDEKLTMLTDTHSFAQIAFDLIELSATQKKYIENLYLKKITARDEQEKDEAKLMANAAIGYYQKFNPFIRAYIVQCCNKCILDLLDNDSILWNTDAIFSLKRRPELELGHKIGQFKEIKIDKFVYRGNNYQINDEIPKYRGVAKSWFPIGWNMLKDPVPKRNNVYLFDKDNLTLKLNGDYWKWRN